MQQEKDLGMTLTGEVTKLKMAAFLAVLARFAGRMKISNNGPNH